MTHLLVIPQAMRPITSDDTSHFTIASPDVHSMCTQQSSTHTNSYTREERSSMRTHTQPTASTPTYLSIVPDAAVHTRPGTTPKPTPFDAQLA